MLTRFAVFASFPRVSVNRLGGYHKRPSRESRDSRLGGRRSRMSRRADGYGKGLALGFGF